MKILLTLLLPLLVMAWSSPSADDRPDPDWVKEMTAKNPKFLKITRCMSEGMEVWKVNTCVTCHDKITKVYDRNHNLVCQYGGVARQNTCADEGVTFQDCEVIYKPARGMGLGY